MSSSWAWRDARPGGRWVSLNELRGVFDDCDASEPSGNTRPLSTSSRGEPEYNIDAISGRKVYTSHNTMQSSNPPNESKSAKTFKGYRSQFSSFQPPPVINLDGPPIHEAELQSYRDPYNNETQELRDSRAQSRSAPPRAQFDVHQQNQASESYDPDGPPLTYEELGTYKMPFKLNSTEKTQSYPLCPTDAELDVYRKAHSGNEIWDHDSPEMTPQEFRAYSEPFKHNEPDGKPEIKHDPMAPTQEELDMYRGRSKLAAFRTSETDTREDLDLLRPSDIRARSGVVRPSSSHLTHAQKLAKRKELERSFNDSQRTSAATLEALSTCADATKARMDILRYQMDVVDANRRNTAPSKASTHHSKKMTGNYSRDFPEEFSTVWTAKGNTLSPKASADPWGYSNTPQGLETSYEREKQTTSQIAGDAKGAFVNSISASTSSSHVDRLQTSLDRAHSKAKSQDDCDAAGFSKKPCGLETSYKEECSASGKPPTIYHSSYGVANEVTTAEATQSPGETEADLGTRNQFDNVVESLHKRYDGFSEGQLKSTRMLEETTTRLDEMARRTDELTRKTNKVLQTLAGVLNENKRADHNAEVRQLELDAAKLSATTPKTLYKVLAYDPMLQEVEMIETSSIVTDNSGVMTPAEVLMKMKSPTKFFPYFAPLMNDGWEIVSGGDHTLVFKKVRDADGTIKSSASMTKSASSVPKTTVSEDMEKANAVRHSLNEKLKRFNSKIDVRRQEPVFSGSKAAWEDEEGTRKSGPSGKRILLGAGWVAACCYAVGVVSEFFTTGGSDGKGATEL